MRRRWGCVLIRIMQTFIHYLVTLAFPDIGSGSLASLIPVSRCGRPTEVIGSCPGNAQWNTAGRDISWGCEQTM